MSEAAGALAGEVDGTTQHVRRVLEDWPQLEGDVAREDDDLFKALEMKLDEKMLHAFALLEGDG